MMKLPILVVFVLTVFLIKLGHGKFNKEFMPQYCTLGEIIFGIFHRGPSFFLANKYKNKISLIQTA